MAKEQAVSWAQVKVGMNAIDKAYSNMMAPPQPRDSWSEKVNALHRVLEGMREQLNSEIENEDMRNELGADGE